MKIKSGEDTNHQSIVRVSHDFKTGDKVRERIDQNIYSKSDVIHWSHEIYTVIDVVKNKIYITDHDRYFKPYELMKIVDEVGVYDNIETTHEKEHIILKKKKKIDKELKEVGIDQKNDLGESKRIKKPSYKVIANSQNKST